MAFNWGTKDPDEQFEVQHNWEPRFTLDGVDTGDSLILDTDPDPDKHPKAILPDGSTLEVFAIVPVDGTAKLQYWLRGGTDGEKVKIVLEVHTAQNRIFQESAVLKIKSV